MKLTKYTHACVALEQDDTTIVIDPGVYTPDVEAIIKQARAILITHDHADHIHKDQVLAALQSRNDLDVYGPQSVIELLGGTGEHIHQVKYGDQFDVGPFHIDVYGETHAAIHPERPPMQNVCCFINGVVFHPGDSFTDPECPVKVLLLPTSGPWMKLSEAADYVRTLKPDRIIEIHERINSDIGSTIARNILGENGLTGIKLEQLAHGESTEV